MSRKVDPACFSSCNILIFFSFYQEAKKKYDKETEKYCGILEKHLNLSSKKKESQLQEVRNCTSILNKLINFTWCWGIYWLLFARKSSVWKRPRKPGAWSDAWMAFLSSHPHHPLWWLCSLSGAEEHAAGQDHPLPCWGALITRMYFCLANWSLFFLFLSPLTLILYSITRTSPLTLCLCQWFEVLASEMLWPFSHNINLKNLFFF